MPTAITAIIAATVRPAFDERFVTACPEQRPCRGAGERCGQDFAAILPQPRGLADAATAVRSPFDRRSIAVHQ